VAVGLATLSTATWLTSNVLGGAHYSSDGIWVVNVFAQLLAFGLVGLLIAELRQRLVFERSLSRQDSLTGLLNVRAFHERGEQLIGIARRGATPITLAYLDLDGFKAVNDRHGHQVGDEVLIALAGLLRRSLRPEDYVARWGGEEFILLFSDTDIEGGRVIAEKIRELVADRERFVEEAPVAITVTVGGCLFEGEGEVGPLLRRADEVLHAAKAAGRDRVVIEA
jgi:diguanylate cyclase (GGDEF)-like protein